MGFIKGFKTAAGVWFWFALVGCGILVCLGMAILLLGGALSQGG